MKVRYDDKDIELTPRLIAALIEVMQATCAIQQDVDPHGAWCWETGRCTIRSWEDANGIEFCYGAHGDFDDGLGDFAVVVAGEQPGGGREHGE